VQQILYGGTLTTYVCANLIGKSLLDKVAVPVQLVLTDREPVLDLRLKVEMPVLWQAQASDARTQVLATAGAAVLPAAADSGPLLCHPQFLADVGLARDLLAKADSLDLAEPFARIREAVSEARKMGVTGR
jgi:hypothetical protein